MSCATRLFSISVLRRRDVVLDMVACLTAVYNWQRSVVPVVAHICMYRSTRYRVSDYTVHVRLVVQNCNGKYQKLQNS